MTQEISPAAGRPEGRTAAAPAGAVSAAAVAETPGIRREGPVIALLAFTVVLVVMNTMMFNLALPKVAAEFALSPSTTSWIVTGYSIVFAISTITYSRLSDFVPIRTLVTVALLSLGGASLVGIFSDNFGLLMGARLVQASGAGAIPALAMVLMTRYVPLSRRGKATSFILSASSLGLGLGPVAGGSIVQFLGWHFLFVITSVTLLLIPAFLKLLPIEKPARGSFDYAGALLLGVGTTGLLLFLTSRSPWALLAGVGALLLFTLRIRSAANPFVLPALFRDRPFLTLGAIGICAYMISFAFLFLAPQLLARQFDLAPGVSGLVLFPGALLAMLASNWVGGIIDRFGNGGLLRVVPWLLLLSVVLLALTAVHSFYAIAAVYMLTSLSFSTISSAVSNELSRLLPGERIGSGMGLFQLMQFFSGAFGVALSGSALVWQQKLPLTQAFDHLFWGMAVVALLGIVSAWRYARHARRAVAVTARI